MSAARQNFNSVARAYKALEFLAFGGDLERARFSHISRLVGLQEVLILGDGDGRFAHKLASLDPQIRLHCIDHSASMIALSKDRMKTVASPERVVFTQADATHYTFETGRYDAVTTLFFLDCFRNDQVESLVPKIAGSLKNNALWLFSDFQIAPKGLARWRSQIWVGVLYTFFRWQTGITARSLPASEAIIAQNGFAEVGTAGYQAGLLRSAVFKKIS